MNIKVIKKCQPLISTSTPLFQGYPSFLAKCLVPPPQVTQFFEGPIPLPPGYTQTMPFFAQNYLIYPKLQHNKDCFTKLLIVICKILSKYEIMPKLAKNIECTLSYTEKMPFLVQIYLTQNVKATKTVLPNFGLSF